MRIRSGASGLATIAALIAGVGAFALTPAFREARTLPPDTENKPLGSVIRADGKTYPLVNTDFGVHTTALFSPVFQAAQKQEELVVPVRFHLVQGATLSVKGKKLDVWVKPEEVIQILLPEVNRIWKQANIRFVIESVIKEPITASPEHEKILEQIAAFKRGDADEAKAGPMKLARKLFDPGKFHATAINVYLFPYIGETMQGESALGGNRVLVGAWSDKASGGSNPPEKVLLTEPEPMVKGSLGRTMAHELGHSLTLNHPLKKAQPKGRLMGGGRQGYLLTPDEITQARESAVQHRKASAKDTPSADAK